MPNDFIAYDGKAWGELERWEEKRLAAKSRHLLPAPVRQQLEKGREVAQERLAALPGVDQFQTAFIRALEAIQQTINRVAVATVRKEAVISAYRKRGHEITELSDIQNLELQDIDKVKPRLDLRYILSVAAEGAAAGLAVSGGEILAAGGAVAGAGAGAAPGAGTLVGAMAADAAVVIAASARAVAQTAAYYGYDPEAPEERVFALGVLNFGTASQAGKLAAYAELNKIVQQLARQEAWKQLNKSAVTRIVKVVYSRLSIKITKQKLGQAVPVLGVLVGSGLNAEMLARVVSDADHLYRQRWLRDKYGLPLPQPVVESSEHSDEVPIAKIIDAELVEAREEERIS